MKVQAFIAAATLALTATVPAHAVVYTVDWAGIMDDGEDSTGLFGPAGSLIGQTAHLKFRIDTETPGAIYGTDDTGIFITGFDHSSPVSASVTINGRTRDIITHDLYVPAYPFTVIEHNDTQPSSGFAEEINQGPGTDQIFESVNQRDQVHVFSEVNNYEINNYFNNYAQVSIRSYLHDISDGDFSTPPISSYIVDENDLDPYARFMISQSFSEYFAGSRPPEYTYNDFAFGHFRIASFSVTVDGAGSAPVPEPATWALMIMGFGAVGSALRGSRWRRAPAGPRPFERNDQQGF